MLINVGRLSYLWFSLFFFTSFENKPIESQLGCNDYIFNLKKFGVVVAGVHSLNLLVNLIKYRDIYQSRDRNKHKHALTYALVLYGIYLIPLGMTTLAGTSNLVKSLFPITIYRDG